MPRNLARRSTAALALAATVALAAVGVTSATAAPAAKVASPATAHAALDCCNYSTLFLKGTTNRNESVSISGCRISSKELSLEVHVLRAKGKPVVGAQVGSHPYQNIKSVMNNGYSYANVTVSSSNDVVYVDATLSYGVHASSVGAKRYGHHFKNVNKC